LLKKIHLFLKKPRPISKILFEIFKEKFSRKINNEYLKCFYEYTNTPIKKINAKIYVIGDSHTNFFGGTEYINFLPLENHINTSCNLVDFFKTFHLGPALAYNSNTNSSTNTLAKTLYLIEKNYLPPKSTLLLCFGEIDIRVHVLKQAEKQNKTVEQVIEDILDNYLKYLKILQNKGYHIICWGAIASQKDEWETNPDYPKYGSEIERNQATSQFNKKLKEICLANKLRFLSIFDDLVTADGETIEDFLAKDKCHLSQKAIPLVVKALIDNEIFTLQNNELILNSTIKKLSKTL